MYASKHVLGVARVALLPRLVVQLVDEAASVVALVEGDGDESRGCLAGAAVAEAGVPGGYHGGGYGCHLLGGLETRVEKP